MQVLRMKGLLFGVVLHNITNNEWNKFTLICFYTNSIHLLFRNLIISDYTLYHNSKRNRLSVDE